MITLLAGLAMAAPCLDTDLDEVLAIGGPPYEILADGALRITIPTDDYWGALPAAWPGGLP